MNADTQSVLLEALQHIADQQAKIASAQQQISRAVSLIGMTLRSHPVVENIVLEKSIMHLATTLAAESHGVLTGELYQKNRSDRVVLPRQLAMYLGMAAGLSSTAVGTHFHKDHGTALHAKKAVLDRMDAYPQFKSLVATLLARLNQPTEPTELYVGSNPTGINTLHPTQSAPPSGGAASSKNGGENAPAEPTCAASPSASSAPVPRSGKSLNRTDLR